MAPKPKPTVVAKPKPVAGHPHKNLGKFLHAPKKAKPGGY